MRPIVLAAAVLAASASAARAAPASVTVTLGPKLAETAEEKYGLDAVSGVADDLRRQVERKLAASGAYDGGRIELVLEDVKPNRPTFKQLSDTPGLSLGSIGVGGIRIGGRAVAADGRVAPLSYSWYETDIRNVRGYGVWTDADRGISLFADRLAHGRALAAR